MRRDEIHIGMHVRVVSTAYYGAYGVVRDTIRGPGSMLSTLVEFIAPTVETRWITADRLKPTSLLEILALAADDDAPPSPGG